MGGCGLGRSCLLIIGGCGWACVARIDAHLQEKELVWRERMSHLKHGVGEKSRDLMSGFMALFGRDGRIVSHA